MADEISIKDGKYVFADKREKDPWKNRIPEAEIIARKKQVSMRRSVVAKERWCSLSAIDKQEHIRKTKVGQQRSLMIRMIKEKTPFGTCVGCSQDTDNINRDTLPRVVWLCPACLSLHKKYG